MASPSVKTKEKPLIPPKPQYLSKQSSLPKPPDKVINSFEETHHTSQTRKLDSFFQTKALDNKKEDAELADNASKAQRPLPLLPVDNEMEALRFPWFMSVDRKVAEELVSNGPDGRCLVRPSSKGKDTLALTLWYCGRAYNIPIRKKPDGRFALGSERHLEETFGSIENMMAAYEKEELTLYSKGIETGKTKLLPIKP